MASAGDAGAPRTDRPTRRCNRRAEHHEVRCKRAILSDVLATGQAQEMPATPCYAFEGVAHNAMRGQLRNGG
jgi:hypothetical protein